MDPDPPKYRLRSSMKKKSINSLEISDECLPSACPPRRVSFAASSTVKPFLDDPEQNTIWDNTYEESINANSVDSKGNLQGIKSLAHVSEVELTDSVANNVTKFETSMEITCMEKNQTQLDDFDMSVTCNFNLGRVITERLTEEVESHPNFKVPLVPKTKQCGGITIALDTTNGSILDDKKPVQKQFGKFPIAVDTPDQSLQEAEEKKAKGLAERSVLSLSSVKGFLKSSTHNVTSFAQTSHHLKEEASPFKEPPEKKIGIDRTVCRSFSMELTNLSVALPNITSIEPHMTIAFDSTTENIEQAEMPERPSTNIKAEPTKGLQNIALAVTESHASYPAKENIENLVPSTCKVRKIALKKGRGISERDTLSEEVTIKSAEEDKENYVIHQRRTLRLIENIDIAPSLPHLMTDTLANEEKVNRELVNSNNGVQLNLERTTDHLAGGNNIKNTLSASKMSPSLEKPTFGDLKDVISTPNMVDLEATGKILIERETKSVDICQLKAATRNDYTNVSNLMDISIPMLSFTADSMVKMEQKDECEIEVKPHFDNFGTFAEKEVAPANFSESKVDMSVQHLDFLDHYTFPEQKVDLSVHHSDMQFPDQNDDMSLIFMSPARMVGGKISSDNIEFTSASILVDDSFLSPKKVQGKVIYSEPVNCPTNSAYNFSIPSELDANTTGKNGSFENTSIMLQNMLGYVHIERFRFNQLDYEGFHQEVREFKLFIQQKEANLEQETSVIKPRHSVVDEKIKRISLARKSIMNSSDSSTDLDMDASEPSLNDKIQEFFKQTDVLTLEHHQENFYIFSTYGNFLWFAVDLEPDCGHVTNIRSRIVEAKKETPIQMLTDFVLENLANKISMTHLTSSLGINFDMLSLLDHVVIEVDKSYDFGLAFIDTQLHHRSLQFLPNNTISYEIIVTGKKLVWWILEFQLTSIEKINPDSLKVESKWGSINRDHLDSILRNTEQGVDMIGRFIKGVLEYFEKTQAKLKSRKPVGS